MVVSIAPAKVAAPAAAQTSAPDANGASPQSAAPGASFDHVLDGEQRAAAPPARSDAAPPRDRDHKDHDDNNDRGGGSGDAGSLPPAALVAALAHQPAPLVHHDTAEPEARRDGDSDANDGGVGATNGAAPDAVNGSGTALAGTAGRAADGPATQQRGDGAGDAALGDALSSLASQAAGAASATKDMHTPDKEPAGIERPGAADAVVTKTGKETADLEAAAPGHATDTILTADTHAHVPAIGAASTDTTTGASSAEAPSATHGAALSDTDAAQAHGAARVTPSGIDATTARSTGGATTASAETGDDSTTSHGAPALLGGMMPVHGADERAAIQPEGDRLAARHDGDKDGTPASTATPHALESGAARGQLPDGAAAADGRAHALRGAKLPATGTPVLPTGTPIGQVTAYSTDDGARGIHDHEAKTRDSATALAPAQKANAAPAAPLVPGGVLPPPAIHLEDGASRRVEAPKERVARDEPKKDRPTAVSSTGASASAAAQPNAALGAAMMMGAAPVAPRDGAGAATPRHDASVDAAGGVTSGASAAANKSGQASAPARGGDSPASATPWSAVAPNATPPAQARPHVDAARTAPHTVERTVMTPISEGIFVRMGALRATPSWSSFHVVLQPRSLGMVTIHMERGANGLHVLILPQHAETQALLDKHLPELISQLHAADPDSPLRVNVLPVSVPHVAHDSSAVLPAAPTPDGGFFGGQGSAAQSGGGQGFDQGGPPPEWTPQEFTAPRPAMAGVAARGMAAGRQMTKGRIVAAGTARIDVQA